MNKSTDEKSEVSLLRQRRSSSSEWQMCDRCRHLIVGFLETCDCEEDSDDELVEVLRTYEIVNLFDSNAKTTFESSSEASAIHYVTPAEKSLTSSLTSPPPNPSKPIDLRLVSRRCIEPPHKYCLSCGDSFMSKAEFRAHVPTCSMSKVNINNGKKLSKLCRFLKSCTIF